MNRSTVRRLISGTKSRIKGGNTSRDDILKAVEYQNFLLLVDEFDNLAKSISERDIYTMVDSKVIVRVKAQRQTLTGALRQLASDSAHANSDGRAINRWSYKKKLHAVSKEHSRVVQSDVVELRELHTKLLDESSLSSGVKYDFDIKSTLHQRTVETPSPGYSNTSTFNNNPDPTWPIELLAMPEQPTTQNPTSAVIKAPPTPNAPRGCILILSLAATFVLFSCISGTYLTLEKNLGYSMGDAFTLAGYIVAVGTLVSSAALASHWPSCRCWKGRGVKRCDGMGDG